MISTGFGPIGSPPPEWIATGGVTVLVVLVTDGDGLEAAAVGMVETADGKVGGAVLPVGRTEITVEELVGSALEAAVSPDESADDVGLDSVVDPVVVDPVVDAAVLDPVVVEGAVVVGSGAVTVME